MKVLVNAMVVIRATHCTLQTYNIVCQLHLNKTWGKGDKKGKNKTHVLIKQRDL